MPNKTKTPSALTLEAQSSIPNQRGNESMQNSTVHSKQMILAKILDSVHLYDFVF